MLTAHEALRISPLHESVNASLLKVCLYCRDSSHYRSIRLLQNEAPPFIPWVLIIVGDSPSPISPFQFHPDD